MNVIYTLVIIIGLSLVITLGNTPLIFQYQAEAQSKTQLATELGRAVAAPVAISGDNIYIKWTNKTANNNDEVMFRASTDGGATFGEKINLSNTTEADSTAEIDSDADSVVVTWWETNQTDDTPVARVSTDNGQTFGPFLRLANNGTIGGDGE